MRTIRQKLDSDKYVNVDAFEADIALMIQNAITFNGVESDVGEIAIKVEDHLRSAIANWKQGNSKKRKDGEKRPRRKREADAIYMKTYDEFRLSVACLLLLEPLAAVVRAVLLRPARVDIAVRAAMSGHDGGIAERGI